MTKQQHEEARRNLGFPPKRKENKMSEPPVNIGMFRQGTVVTKKQDGVTRVGHVIRFASDAFGLYILVQWADDDKRYCYELPHCLTVQGDWGAK